ncbi:MAG TPA: crotonyl-CoA carboxylase/reductase, partial [Marmoricola sp.]|nr:crotonyl-CoA carboxylase/reductase [Marmoricola sp.]
MNQILDAIMAGDTSSDDYANLPMPEAYLAATVHKDEVEMFAGMPSRDKDPRQSLHVEEVALPELGPGEALLVIHSNDSATL